MKMATTKQIKVDICYAMCMHALKTCRLFSNIILKGILHRKYYVLLYDYVLCTTLYYIL